AVTAFLLALAIAGGAQLAPPSGLKSGLQSGSGRMVAFLARVARSADPDGVCRNLDMWVPYTHNIDEIIRSIAPREFIRSNWTGYHSDPDGLLSRYWRSIILGADSIWWWMWSAIDPWRGFQAPDFEPYPATREMLDETRILRDGLGDLLINSEMQDDGIAMLYSQPSSFAATVERGPGYGDYEAVNAAWYTIINDIPLMYRYVTDGMIDRGEFEADKYRVLILPFALALSEKTESAIRAFVKNGGTVIADIRPGIYDGRCKPLKKGRLDDLFGIEGPVNTAAIKADISVDGKLGKHDIKLDWPDVPVDPALKTTSGQALGKAGEAPVFIVNSYGKGRAILLNLATSAFGGRVTGTGLTGLDSAEELDPKLWAAFDPIFEAAGVQPAIRLIGSRRWKVPFVGNARLQRWRNGDMEIFGVYRATGEGVRTIARLPGERQAFVYNLTAGLTLGDPYVSTYVKPYKGEKWFYFSLVPSRASFFAILPGPAPAIAVKLEEPRIRRGERIRLDISLPDAGKSIHALKLRGIGPDAVEGWSQVVLAGAKPVTVEIPVAFNDPPGTYRITVTDVITRDTEVEIYAEALRR
ncbi:MAG: beta-galactosidase trimerization domain-containing protein, partial [Phycisphaeraceae bacterium]|nr:beta-galactosidase trimerization domain-containing protein [Phycisphaeraceae bacterium]